MREEPKIAREKLRACLREQYELTPVSIDYLPLGMDMNAGVYRVVSQDGTAYLLKIKSGKFYTPSCLVSRYLYDQGITSVVAPLRTRSDALWAHAEQWTFAVYPYLDGSTGRAGMTDEHWRRAGAIARQVHDAVVPASGFEDVRRETFDPSGYTRSFGQLEPQLATSRAGDPPSARALRRSFARYRPRIQALLTSLDKLSAVLRSRTYAHVICHADFHPGNLLRDQTGDVFVVDWDDVMLAPRERDFIFVGEPADASTGYSGSPFFQGYGRTEVDWITLTYYRYERVVTDLIEYAGHVLFREDLGEEARAAAVRRFVEGLEGRNFRASEAAAAHIPKDLAAQ